MEGLEIRYSLKEDRLKWLEWLSDPVILRWFPMCSKLEIEDAVQIWETYIPKGAVLTAVMDGVVCGVANLYIQPFKKLSHQCLFATIVDQKYRQKGIGTKLLEELIDVAKKRFHIEQLHLEVYDGNPAIHLYEKLGFKRFGYQKHFIKENNEYIGKIFMQRFL